MTDEALSQDPLHPRRTADLLGHDAAERALLAAYGSGRLPHAWLITGPKGVGNAVNETVVYAFICLFVINVVMTAIGVRISAK